MTLQEKVQHLTAGIQAFLDGDPRKFRPPTCSHGVKYGDRCERCISDYFKKLLREVAEPEPN